MKTAKRNLLRMAVFLPMMLLLFPSLFQDNACGAQKIVLQLRWDHQFQFAGYYAALWQGYYRDAGLDVEIRSAITPEQKILQAMKEVAEGRADFGVGAADILVARDRGAPLVLLAVIFQQSAARFYALEKTSLKSPADLLRLRVARNVNDLIDVEFQAMLRAEGIDPAMVKAWPHQPGIDHLADGRVDVIPGYSTSMRYYGERRGLRLVSLVPSSYGVDFYGDSLFTHERLIKTEPEMVEKFKEASLRGWRYALDHPADIADRISGELKRRDPLDDVKAFNRFQIERIEKLTLHPVIELGHINEERWRRMHAILRKSGIIKGTFDSAAFVYDPVRLKQDQMLRIWRITLVVVGILLLIVLVSVLWNRRLRIAVRQRDDALEQLRRYQEKLEYSAVHDALTGLFNRSSLDEMLDRTAARAKRGKASSLLYMDLDNFKDINDTVGHTAGDQALITLTGLLRAELRTEDVVFRLGGDEFVILLDGLNGRESLPVAERIRSAVAAHPFTLHDRVFQLSLSIGLIEIDGTLTRGELLSRADAAMYRAKEQGKNRVAVA